MGDARSARWTLVATVAGSALGFLDLGVVGVLLPLLQDEFGTGITPLQWVVAAMTLFLSSLLLVGGALGDRFGRRRAFAIGVALYGAASLAAAAAPTIGGLIAARAAQGVGAALLVPGSLALIAANIPREERGRAYGTWAAASGLMAAGGPYAAGLLAQTVSWRAVFLAFVPLALVVLALLAKVPESRAQTARLDAPGAALGTLAIGGIAFGLIEANRRGFGAPLVLAALAAGALALAGFIAWELRARHPMLPFDLFRERAFAGANLATLLIYTALSGALFFVPFMLIQVHGYSPANAGAAGIPFALLLTLLSRPAGDVADRIGARAPLVVGAFATALGFLAFARIGATGDYWTTFFPAYLVLGIGMALVIAPLTRTVMASPPPERAGVASGVNNAIARLAGLLAVALFGLLAVQIFAGALPGDVRATLGEGVRELARAHAPGAEDAVRAAFVAAFRGVMLVAAGLCALGAGVAWATVPGRAS